MKMKVVAATLLIAVSSVAAKASESPEIDMYIDQLKQVAYNAQSMAASSRWIGGGNTPNVNLCLNAAFSAQHQIEEETKRFAFGPPATSETLQRHDSVIKEIRHQLYLYIDTPHCRGYANVYLLADQPQLPPPRH